MTKVITVVATGATVSNLHRGLTDVDGVRPLEVDDWNGAGSSLNAPFNPRRADEGLVAMTALFDDKARGVLIGRLLDALRTAPPQELLLLDPLTGGEIGRLKPGATAEDVVLLLERAPGLDGLGAFPEADANLAEESRVATDQGEDVRRSEDMLQFYFVLEGDKVKQDRVVAPSDFDLVFRYDTPSAGALATVRGSELERQRQRPKGSIDLLISLEGNLELRGGQPFGRVEFIEGELAAPVRFQFHALAPGDARVLVNFQVRGATIYRLVLDIHLVEQIDAAVVLRQPLDIDLDEIKRSERAPRDVKLIINDTGGGWQASFLWDKQYGEVPKEITNLNPGQLYETLNSIKPLLESVAKSPVWKNIGSDLSMSGGASLPLDQINGNLLTAGWRLYNVLSKSDFGDYIRKIETLPWGSRISIETKSAFIPWELMYPLEYNQAWSDTVPLKSQHYAPEKLWGNRFQIEVLLIGEKSETVLPPLQPGPIGISMIVGKTVAGGETSSEAVEWQNQYFQKHLSSMGEFLTDKDKIQQVFVGRDYPATFIYLLCHGQSKSPPTVVDDILEFDKDFTITPDSMVTEYCYPRRPVIFVNSCSVGAISPLAFTSFLRAFLKKKAFGLIASSFSLPTRFAAAFGQKLLDGYIANQPIGDVLFKLRHALHEKGIPLGMFYSLQCPLDVRAPWAEQ